MMMYRIHVSVIREHMSMAVHGTSHGANDFCSQQPNTCMVENHVGVDKVTLVFLL